ncbi:MAG: hypothetical protein ABI548_26510 [Polyangiaceae bacterium]
MNLYFHSSSSLSARVSTCARGLVSAVAGASLVVLGACSQTPVAVDLHSLQASGKVSFVCRADDGSPAGHKLDECPDYEHATRRLLGLVTQTATNEVAIVDLYAGAVVDVDPTTPGYSFLRVGASPGAIVTTPGGAASFVGVSGFQKNGIFALPTTCLSPPKASEVSRDLTTWAACSLSSAPGEITVLVDPPAAKGGAIRGACDGTPQAKPDLTDRECPADLTAEGGPVGRRKLLVSLPDEHKLVLLDAQSLLDRPAGEFTSCTVEASYGLNAQLPTSPIQPVLPPDLQIDKTAAGADACVVTQYPPLTATAPTPDGFALSGTTLYVGDSTLPVVHVLDVSDPCAVQEQDPLLPYSYEAPGRVVTTTRVAVSPLTPSGKQFVYAIDRNDFPSNSVMVFDVSPGSTNRVPLLFPGEARQPYLPPDRLRFGPNVKDVAFVQRDFPAPDLTTGVGQYGLACDPYPDSTGPGIQYRPNSDFSSGARPLNLRGVFGFALLSDGHVAVIDVEDFDAPCRRPETSNTSNFVDFRGCEPDKAAPGETAPPLEFTDVNKVLTVTGESTCNVIEANRPRSASLSISNSSVGLRAPTLRSFPQFTDPDPAAVLSAEQQPHLLAVDFPNPDPNATAPVTAQVNISAQVYCTQTNGLPPCDATAQTLVVDPNKTLQNSLVLPLSEPRSYAADETPVLTFEGPLFSKPSMSGFIQVTAGDPNGTLHDPDANFCGAGVEDSASILTEAESLQVPSKRRAAWASAHADYVQITGDFPLVDDVYWNLGAQNRCNRDACATEFGTIDDPTQLSKVRDLSIVEASGDHLLVTPRCEKADGSADDTCDPATVLQDVHCCFPAGTAYTVRASNQWLLSGPSGVGSALHDLAAGADGRCVHTATCDPRKKYFHARAFEVCDSANDPAKTCKDTNPAVTCVATTGAGIPVTPGGTASQCIFEDLTARFVVYRGANASTRGMSFSWQTTGGFTPLTMSLATQSSNIDPTSMSYLPEVGYLGVIDASTLGLSLFDLNSLGVVAPSPFF